MVLVTGESSGFSITATIRNGPEAVFGGVGRHRPEFGLSPLVTLEVVGKRRFSMKLPYWYHSISTSGLGERSWSYSGVTYYVASSGDSSRSVSRVNGTDGARR